MTALLSKDVLRPGPNGAKAWIANAILAALPFGFSVLRRIKPIVTVGGFTLTSRYDHVREVFATDAQSGVGRFGVTYKPKLDVIMGGEPFFLGLADTPQYQLAVNSMRKVTSAADLPLLGQDVEARAEAIVGAAKGRIDVVDQLRG